MGRFPDDAPERHPLLGHRCFEAELRGPMRFDPPRARREGERVAVIELPEDFAAAARERFFKRHNIELDPPEFGFHMTVFSPHEGGERISRLWGCLEGQRCSVQLTHEMFWKGRCVWVNAHCAERDMLRETLAGLGSHDAEAWGHATIGTFPPGCELPRFLDYGDLPDWGFRP